MNVAIRSLLAVGCVVSALAADGALFYFDLEGKAGLGLLPGNENPSVTAVGSGGVIGGGIFYDDATNILTLNFGWGSANGFTNLSGNATAGHIHGPTSGTGTASFTQNSGVAYGLDNRPGWSANATSGGFSGTVTLTEPHEANLLAGQFYVNVHTATNPGGEIRGNLVQAVPEPASAALLGLGVLGSIAGCTRIRQRVGGRSGREKLG
jgi:hypothetical protein